MRTKILPDPVATFSIRVPADLKNQCSALANAQEITLNRWMNICMSNQALMQNDTRFSGIMRKIPDFLKEVEIPGVNDEHDFIVYACQRLLETMRCPGCGKLTYLDGVYCTHCGYELRRVHPDTGSAKGFYLKFIKENKPPKGWGFSLAHPFEKDKNQQFVIVRFPLPGLHRKTIEGMQIVRILSGEDIEAGRKIYEANPDEVDRMFYSVTKEI